MDLQGHDNTSWNDNNNNNFRLCASSISNTLRRSSRDSNFSRTSIFIVGHHLTNQNDPCDVNSEIFSIRLTSTDLYRESSPVTNGMHSRNSFFYWGLHFT